MEIVIKEKFRLKVKRILRGLITSQNKKIHLLADIAGQVYDHVHDFGGCKIMIAGQALLVTDFTEESCYTAVMFEVLGQQALVVVDEDNDYIGIGRSIKKLLEGQGFHVYYENKPIAKVDDQVAIGYEAVRHLYSLQRRATRGASTPERVLQ